MSAKYLLCRLYSVSPTRPKNSIRNVTDNKYGREGTPIAINGFDDANINEAENNDDNISCYLSYRSLKNKMSYDQMGD